MEPLLVRVAEAAELASVSRAKAYEMVATGEWPSLKIGRTIRVPVNRLHAWIDAQFDDPPQPINTGSVGDRPNNSPLIHTKRNGETP